MLVVNLARECQRLVVGRVMDAGFAGAGPLKVRTSRQIVSQPNPMERFLSEGSYKRVSELRWADWGALANIHRGWSRRCRWNQTAPAATRSPAPTSFQLLGAPHQHLETPKAGQGYEEEKDCRQGHEHEHLDCDDPDDPIRTALVSVKGRLLLRLELDFQCGYLHPWSGSMPCYHLIVYEYPLPLGPSSFSP